MKKQEHFTETPNTTKPMKENEKCTSPDKPIIKETVKPSEEGNKNKNYESKNKKSN